MTGFRMQGRVALVTGGASGIGRGTALAFAREGVQVAVADLDQLEGRRTVEIIERNGGKACFIACDVTRAEEVRHLVDECVTRYGALDYAFNNAGVGPDGKRLPVVSIGDMPDETWAHTLAVNLTGVFYCMKYEIRQMLNQKSGAIVNTASVAALKALPGYAAYAASKHGLAGLTKAAALETARSGIRINAICPGPTDHTMLMANLDAAQPGRRDHLIEDIPLGRLAVPEEMAQAVLWLCSEAASFVTGHIMPVDGGMAAQ